MTPRYTGAAFLCLTALSACATVPAQDSSYSSGVSTSDAQALSIQASDILTASMDPRQTTLRVLRFRPTEMRVQQTFDNALRSRGFALAPEGMAYPGALTVRLTLQATPQHLLMTLHAGDGEMTCSYVHDTAGQLVRKAGCTLLEGTAVTLHAPQVQTIPVMTTPTTSISGLTPSAASQSAVWRSSVTPTGPNTPPQNSHHGSAPAMEVATPVAPNDPETYSDQSDANRQWVLSRGEPIREQIIAWGAQVGWTVKWPEDINWTIPATAVVTGDFADRDHGPIEQIVDALAEQGRAIKVNFHFPNKTLVVTPGDVR